MVQGSGAPSKQSLKFTGVQMAFAGCVIHLFCALWSPGGVRIFARIAKSKGTATLILALSVGISFGAELIHVVSEKVLAILPGVRLIVLGCWHMVR